MKARITVYPRRVILDPQGKAIREALVRSGFGEVAEVRAGKCFDLELSTTDPLAAELRLREMAEKLLANMVVEDFEIAVGPAPVEAER